MLFLDAQHRLIEMEELFRGTLTQTSVYPREVVRAALQLNAGRRRARAQPPVRHGAAVARRRALTQTLKTALRSSTCACSTTSIVGAGAGAVDGREGAALKEAS